MTDLYMSYSWIWHLRHTSLCCIVLKIIYVHIFIILYYYNHVQLTNENLNWLKFWMKVYFVYLSSWYHYTKLNALLKKSSWLLPMFLRNTEINYCYSRATTLMVKKTWGNTKQHSLDWSLRYFAYLRFPSFNHSNLWWGNRASSASGVALGTGLACEENNVTNIAWIITYFLIYISYFLKFVQPRDYMWFYFL